MQDQEEERRLWSDNLRLCHIIDWPRAPTSSLTLCAPQILSRPETMTSIWLLSGEAAGKQYDRLEKFVTKTVPKEDAATAEKTLSQVISNLPLSSNFTTVTVKAHGHTHPSNTRSEKSAWENIFQPTTQPPPPKKKSKSLDSEQVCAVYHRVCRRQAHNHHDLSTGGYQISDPPSTIHGKQVNFRCLLAMLDSRRNVARCRRLFTKYINIRLVADKLISFFFILDYN